MSPVGHDLGDLVPVILGSVASLRHNDGNSQISLLGGAPALLRRHLGDSCCCCEGLTLFAVVTGSTASEAWFQRRHENVRKRQQYNEISDEEAKDRQLEKYLSFGCRKLVVRVFEVGGRP